MFAMQLVKQGQPLTYVNLPIPSPGAHDILIKVHACGICRTDLHIIDGELKEPKLPLIPGHQIVGEIAALGSDVRGFQLQQRVGVPWLGHTCHHCPYCLSGQENLCDHPLFTGYQLNGGFAQYCIAAADFCLSIPSTYSDVHAAPLLCAGLIGYRALSKTGSAKRIGIYGFGAAAHIVLQVAKYQGREIYAFTRPGDQHSQAFASKLGADWAGDADKLPPKLLDAAIIFAPNGELVPQALRALKKGGLVVCGGIHMSDIPSFPYEILWGERGICSVANLTRQDGEAFFKLASLVHIHTNVTVYPLIKANEALNDLRAGKFHGAGVISMQDFVKDQ